MTGGIKVGFMEQGSIVVVGVLRFDGRENQIGKFL